jgi:hypothetical protein
VVLPDEAPPLAPTAARALLRVLVKAAKTQNAGERCPSCGGGSRGYRHVCWERPRGDGPARAR